MSSELYPGKRENYATSMLEANKLVIGNRIDKSYNSLDGHIVVRVLPSGDEYAVYALKSNNKFTEVSSVFNYRSW